MAGKHSQDVLVIAEYEEKLRQEKAKYKALETRFADTLTKIRELNESNTLGDPSIRKRKISELCTDIRYELIVEKNKKIELPNTDQVKK